MILGQASPTVNSQRKITKKSSFDENM